MFASATGPITGLRSFLAASILAAVLSAVVATPNAAMAATVQVDTGEILVNQGKGFKRIAQSTTVNPGDSVMARGKGQGRIVYGNGCVIEVAAGTVQTVVAEELCLLGLTDAGAGGAAGVGPVVVGAAIIGGGVAAAVALGQHSSGASP